jgi:hypothetical protein
VTTPGTEMVGISDRGRAPRLLMRLVCGYQWLASREMLACGAILALTLGLRAALLPWLPVPQPTVHDEFSYLLAADTYAHGRLTNPPHPFWQHFETFHVLQQPTYASKYQPLQGLVLAFGQKFFGQPWIGVYLSAGLMCAAICWMLQGWISPGWALLGAILCVLRVGVLSYWMNSYFGGAVPGIGGALALGAAARIWRRGQFGQSTTWALGLAIVVLSRPYDAAVLGCATSAILLWFLRKFRTPWRTICVRVGLPALVVLTMCAAVVAYNDYRVTGHALTLPYQAHERQYAMASMFTMMPLIPETQYRHSVMRQFWAGWNVEQRAFAQAHPVVLLLRKLYIFDDFFFPLWVLLIPVLLCPYDLATAEERATVFLLLVFVLMIAPLIAIQPHYAAVFAGVIYLRFLHSLTRLWSWRPWDKPVGRALGVLLVVLLASQGLRFTYGRDKYSRSIAEDHSHFESARRSMMQVLEKQPGRQLVLLSYASDHTPHEEWVYNRADIDASPIVWAREMGPEQDRPFLEYFRDRRVWLLEPDTSPAKLSPYPRQEQGQP